MGVYPNTVSGTDVPCYGLGEWGTAALYGTNSTGVGVVGGYRG